MVVALVAGAAALLIGGYLLVAVSSFIVHWLPVAAGFIGGSALFYKLVKQDPLPVTESEMLNTVLYGVYSAVAGFIAYKAIQAALAVFGVLAAFLVGVVLVAGYYVGFVALLGGFWNIVEVGGEVFGGE